MSDELATLFSGAIAGGAVALLWRTVEKYWVDTKITRALSAEAKLEHYAKPLWLDSGELELRLRHLAKKLQADDRPEAVRLRPEVGQSIDWYTKQGYYATSTVYIMARVSCWIHLYTRDVVLLPFRKDMETVRFFQTVEAVKAAISARPSILWSYYFAGMGEALTDQKDVKPMTFAAFCMRMQEDASFRSFFDQAFWYLIDLSTEDNRHAKIKYLLRIADALGAAKAALEASCKIPELRKNPPEEHP